MDYQYGNNDNNENENRDVNSIPENNTGSAPEPERKKTWNEEWENNTPAQNSNPYINTGYQSGNRNPYENGNYRGTGSTGSYQTGNGSYPYSNGSNPYGTGSSYGNSYQNGSYQGNGYNGGGNGQGPKKKKKGGAALLALGMAAILFAGAGLGIYGSQVWNRISTTPGTKNEQQMEQVGEESAAEESKAGLQQAANTEESAAAESVATTTTSSGNMTVQEIAKNCLPSIVAITNKGVSEVQSIWGVYTTESESAGSGVIIGETDTELLIITNYHVVEGNQTLSVVFSFQENEENPEVVSARVKDYDSSKDLAVISINKEDLSAEVLSNIRVAVVGNSEDLALGEQVVAIGNALGYGQSVTTGIVSALNRGVSLQSEDGSIITNKYIQTDASINPGNSGGGLFNMRGELVGINSAKVASAEVEGMGYSIPISDVSGDIETMMNAETREVVDVEKRGYLGITGSNVTSDVASSYGLPMGVYISGVTAGSPAEQYGLTKGMVVTGINGKTISTIEALKTYLSYYAIGEEVTITAMVQSNEGYVEKEFNIVLGSAAQAGIQSNAENGNSQNGQNGNNGNNGGNYYNNGNGNYGSMDPEDLYNYFFGGGR